MIFSNSELRYFTSTEARQLAIYSLLLLCTFTSLSVFAGAKVDKSIIADGISKVKICNDRGSISVNTWDKNEILVKGEIDDLADSFIFDKSGESILIEVKLTAKHAHGKNNGKGSKLEIWVPKSQDIQFNGIATDLAIIGLTGDVNINSVSGAVIATSLSGNLSIKNISGKTVLNDISGIINVDIVSGDLYANVMSKLIRVKGISSDISVVANKIADVNLFSVSGETKLSGELEENGKIYLENVSGESFFFYRESINAKVSIETGPDGSIINQIKLFDRKDSHLNSQQQLFVEGNGKAIITMHTVSGKVGLKNHKLLKK